MIIDEISFLHRETYNRVIKNDYYVDIFKMICEKHGGLGESFALQRAEKINSFWNEFWFNLPDTSNIQREPFYKICELAEGDYLIEEENYGKH